MEAQLTPTENEEQRNLDLCLIEEKRDLAKTQLEAYKQRVAKFHNARVKERTLHPGDFVLRKTEASRPLEQGKLMPNWEGPYRIKASTSATSYKLETLKGEEIPRSWHISNLRKYYV